MLFTESKTCSASSDSNESVIFTEPETYSKWTYSVVQITKL